MKPKGAIKYLQEIEDQDQEILINWIKYFESKNKLQLWFHKTRLFGFICYLKCKYLYKIF